MRLYTSPFSSNARRAHMTLLHLGVEHEDVIVDLAKRDQKQPTYLALNPNGRVPTLVDGDFVLTESHAIMTYVADKVGAEEIWPRAAKERAEVAKWLFWSAHHMTPAISVLNFEHMVKTFVGAGPADPKEVARGESLVREFAGVLDAHLATREYLAHGRLTLADLSVASPFMSRMPAKLPLEGFANIDRWHAKIRELACWKKTDL